MKGNVVPGNKQTTDAWPAEARLATVIEVASMSTTELSQYCREKGLYVEQVTAWRDACLTGQRSAGAQRLAEREELRLGKKRIRQLERELRQKEKALAEVAALLVLRKKLNALWGIDDEVN